jgi:hypothetical protein
MEACPLKNKLQQRNLPALQLTIGTLIPALTTFAVSSYHTTDHYLPVPWFQLAVSDTLISSRQHRSSLHGQNPHKAERQGRVLRPQSLPPKKMKTKLTKKTLLSIKKNLIMTRRQNPSLERSDRLLLPAKAHAGK